MENGLEHLTDEQIEAAYKQRKKLKQEQLEKKMAAYSDMKNELVIKLVDEALELERKIAEVHERMMNELGAFREVMAEYGELPKRSKGGFSIEDEKFEKRVRLRYRALSEFDERSELAEAHFRSFFERTLKGKDENVFDMLMQLLERKQGKLEASRAMQILKFKDRYDDVDWLKG